MGSEMCIRDSPRTAALFPKICWANVIRSSSLSFAMAEFTQIIGASCILTLFLQGLYAVLRLCLVVGKGIATSRKDRIQRSPALACLELDQLSPCGAEPEFKATFGLLRGLVFLHSAHMPWLANTLWQLLLSLDLFCCRHCWTALSLPSCCRQKRDASRLQACCSCVVPIWLWASEDEMPDSSTRMATTYRMTISRERRSLQNDLGGVASWSLLQRASSATVPYTARAGGSRLPRSSRSLTRTNCMRR